MKPLTPTIRHYLTTAGSDGDQVTDADLLGRFAANRDPFAFELLVWRHTGMVINHRDVPHKCKSLNNSIFPYFLLNSARMGEFITREELPMNSDESAAFDKKRDDFAKAALTGLIMKMDLNSGALGRDDISNIVRTYYKIADQMIQQSNIDDPYEE